MAQQQLGFESMPTRLIKVTPARLATWTDCPRRYRMTYLDRPTPPRGGAWAHSTLGASVHNALRAFFDLPPERRTPEEAAALVRGCWKSEGFAGLEQSAEYRERAQGWVADYVEGLDPGLEPVGLERWVAAPVGTIIAEGRVDRIDERDGELVIVDYKTGRHGLSTDEVRSSQALAMYATAARRTLRRECHTVELHHLPTGEVWQWEHTEATLERHVRRAEETAADLQLAKDTLDAGGDPEILFEARPGRRCAWCDFRRSCPEGQQASAELEPWALLG
ncbi:RecB family exonuclease [Sciscionella sediminilitoris]|uniref:RecB family exonuclease n=1 Tax=Sciscionella sediminilitoris TaxID=1445613 RepID=UPI000AAA3FCF|nr:PD-(D/E)XK nuclease family protein [Sciscionella sp. SE31]